MPVTREESVGDIQCYSLTNGSGVVLKCISLGATVTQVKLKDGTDVVLGFRDLTDYRTNSPYIGCSVGRVANRIRDAKFDLDGKTYPVSANAAPHTLHGGEVGFNKKNWTVRDVDQDKNSVTFEYIGPSGEMGYPGTLTATATYSLAENGEVTVQYAATADSPTIVNLVNHTYFNLAGQGTIHDHILSVNATHFTPLDDQLIAVGTLEPVQGTCYDFRTPTAIGDRMKPGMMENGYDINYDVGGSPVLHSSDSTLHLCASLQDPASNRALRVYSNQPGVQLYTGYYLDGSYVGKDGNHISRFDGVCLETQAWPNAINNPPAKDQVILRPGATYKSKTVWAFNWKNCVH